MIPTDAEKPKANPEHEKEEKQTLLKKIGGPALGIGQVAAYIRYRSLTIKQLLNKWQIKSQDIFIKVMRVAHSIRLRMWQMYFEFEKVQNIYADNVPSLLSMVSPDVISLVLFWPPELSDLCDGIPSNTLGLCRFGTFSTL